MRVLINGGLFLLVIVFSNSLRGQTKEELKNKKQEIEKEINYTKELLNKTSLSKKKSIDYLKVVDSQLNSQQQLSITLNIEIKLLQKQIIKTQRVIKKNKELIEEEKENLQKLKDEYAKMIYLSFKQKESKNEIIYILSSESFNQLYKRILYLKQYRDFRRSQAKKINESQKKLLKNKESLAQKKDKIIEEKASKQILLERQEKELKQTAKIQKEKNELIKQLIFSETKLKKQIEQKKKKTIELEKKIRKIIEEEIKKARENKSTKGLTPEAQLLSKEFTNNKGKLPWPLLKGVIVSAYGKQKHPVFGEVEVFNNGIDIATEKDSEVRVVFDGIVSRIFFVKGEGKAILVSHGEYYSVYSGLKEVFVKTGDKLLAIEKIGKVLTKKDNNITELHFEIWKGYEKNNPAKWLYKAY